MRKIIIVSLIISLLLLTSLTNPVYATSTDYDFGFEDCVAGDLQMITTGLPAGSDNIFTSTVIVDGAYEGVSSSGQRTGTRCFHDWGGQCRFNASYTESLYLINFTMYLYTVTGACTVYFYNKTTSHLLVRMYFSAFQSKSCYYDESGTQIQYDTFVSSVYHKVGFQINNSIGDCGYIYDDAIEGGSSRNPTYIANGERIDQIYIDTGGQDIYYDDWEWTLSTDISFEESEGEPTTQEFCNGIPQYSLLDPLLKGQRFLESKYTDWTGLGLTGNLNNVELPISIDQSYISDDPADYKLRVNGIYFGEADNISEWDDYYDCYWLFWETYNIDIENDFPTFSFWCDAFNGEYYWYQPMVWACSLYPFKYHNITGQWQNTVFDGTYYDDSDCDYDLAYCFTVTSFNYSEPEPPETPDEFIITNLYFNFYDAKTGVKLQMIELSKALTYASLPYFPYEDSYAELLLTLTAMSDGGDETHIYMPVEQEPPYLYSYLSSQPVVYNGVTIAPYGNNTIDFMGGSLGNIAGKVNGKNVLWNRYTVVQEVQPFGDYDIYLIRYGESNWTEPIPDDELPDYEDEYGEFFIEFYDENPDKVVECYYRLGGKQPVLIYQVNDTLFGTYANGYLWEMTDSTGKKLQEGQIIFSSGEKNGFIPVPYVFTKEGYYQIHLYNMTVGSLKNEEVYRGEDVYVCKKTGGGGGGGTGTTPVDFIFVNLGGSALGSIVGMIITIFSLLIPFMVARGMNITGIPMFVYAITGGMGIAISSILGLFPPWLPFFIIALGIIIAVIVYIYSGGSGGE